jgi:alkanesulfonate monooxygenase SsuD/methylene tetrahydromethanopterin reductase-like flavin-dependent oxidoreductase (luciferase family)
VLGGYAREHNLKLTTHPRILIGGGGEKKTLRMVAQYADACNIFDMGPVAVKAKYDVIRGHCETLAGTMPTSRRRCSAG